MHKKDDEWDPAMLAIEDALTHGSHRSRTTAMSAAMAGEYEAFDDYLEMVTK